MVVYKQNSLSKKDLLEAIKRSGYLFESEIYNKLAKAGFFVEANQIIEDPLTGKNRELDLLAAYDRDNKKSLAHKVSSLIKFVFEIKNNSYPLVLMTKFEFSPYIDIGDSLKEIKTTPKGIKWDYPEGFYDKLLEHDVSLFTQYCSFNRKKGNKELMALHPEAIYSGLSKITQYCEEMVEVWENHENDGYFRDFLYLPVLLLKDNLYELEIDKKSKPKLMKVNESKLVFNYYFKGNQRISTIWVVTEQGFNKFVENMIKLECELKKEMIAVKEISQNSKRDYP